MINSKKMLLAAVSFAILLSALPSMAMKQDEESECMRANVPLITKFIAKALEKKDYTEETYNRIIELHQAITKKDPAFCKVKVYRFDHYVDDARGCKCSEPLFCEWGKDSFFRRSGPPNDGGDEFCCHACWCCIPCHLIQFFCGCCLPCGFKGDHCCYYDDSEITIDDNGIKGSLEDLRDVYESEHWKKYTGTCS